jgi:hypothetical protein
MPRRKFHRHRIFDFTVGKNTLQKLFAKPI